MKHLRYVVFGIFLGDFYFTEFIWCTFFQFFVDNPQGQKVKLQMYDYDKASDNESMG